MSKLVYSHGELLVNKDLPSYELTEKWIRNKQFLKYELTQLLLKKKGGRKRNRLYCFCHDCVQCDVVMKVSQIDQSYKFWRKVDLFITGLFKDYNYRGYIGSLKMQEAGIDTIEPIAYWTYKPSWFSRKSYLLYKKIESELTVAQLCNKIHFSDIKEKDILIKAVVNRCVSIVRGIHAANIRHDDPHGNNILIDLKDADIAALDEEKINNARFTLIDNDRCTSARIVIPRVKLFFDLKCLARFQICELPPEELLQQYLGEEYRIYWWYVVNFWISGGFKLHKLLCNLFK